MTKERLAEIKRLCDAATPGPWVRACIMLEVAHGLPSSNIETSKFICESRTIIPELLAAYEKAVDYLKFIEWNGDYHTCRECDQHRSKGHAPECELNKILMGE